MTGSLDDVVARERLMAHRYLQALVDKHRADLGLSRVDVGWRTTDRERELMLEEFRRMAQATFLVLKRLVQPWVTMARRMREAGLL